MGSESSPAAGRSLPPPGTHLPGLDGLRGVAILLVLAFHLLPSQPVTSHVTAWIYRAAWSGWCGVDLFFVLSGFLITGILLDAKGLPHYFRNFYARRTLRIFPLYYGVLVVIFVIVPLFLRPPSPAFEHLQANQIWLWCYASNVCTVWANGWVFLAGNWHLNHFWSLAVEEQFYLVWPLVVLLLSRRRLLAACALCVVAAPLLRWAFLANGYGFVVAYTFTPCRVDALAVGAAVAVAARAPGGLSALRRFAPAVALALGAALLGLFVWRHGLRIADEVMQTAGYSLLALFFAAALVLVVAAPAGGLLGRCAALPALRFFGKYSYGLYVYHGLFLMPFLSVRTETLAGWLGSSFLAVVVQFAAVVGISLGASLLSWHLYEKQFLKLKRYFEARPAAAAGSALPAANRLPRPALAPAPGTAPPGGGAGGYDEAFMRAKE